MCKGLYQRLLAQLVCLPDYRRSCLKGQRLDYLGAILLI